VYTKEGELKLAFWIGEGLASEPRLDEPCVNNDGGSIGREGSAVEVFLGFAVSWAPELPDCPTGSCGGGFTGSEGW